MATSNPYNLSLNELRIVVALERAVARFQNNAKLELHLMYKGGFVLLKTTETIRFTRDLDALAFEISQDKVPDLVKSSLELDLDDGLWFGDVKVEELEDQGSYGGLRFNCAFQIGDPPENERKIKKLSRIHIDVGFGDDLPKGVKKQKMKSILPTESTVSWLVYPVEHIFAEKIEALFSRGAGSSRAKDIYDMVLIFPKCNSKKKLRESIRRTFELRKTPMPDSFYSEAKNFNLSLLQSAWRSVQLAEELKQFDEYWKRFLLLLQVLDQKGES